MGTPLKILKYYHLLIGLVFGLLCFGCAGVDVYIAVRTSKPCPHFLKHNQASTPCPGSSPCPTPNPGPIPSGSPTQVANITVYTGATTISYYFTDGWGVVGCTHDPKHVSLGNCKSTLFTTTFVLGTLTVQPASGAYAGEVTISGVDKSTNTMFSWRSSCNNQTKDDDVTWTQTQPRP
jgi:hypothetical protein